MNEEVKTEARTDWIAPSNTFQLQGHDWLQYGTQIVCESCKFKHGSVIPAGKTLTGEKGAWQLIDTPVSR